MSTTTTAPRRPPRLVLHFDLNETIMVTDAAGGDDFSACLNKMVAKSIFLKGDFRKHKHGDGAALPLTHHDGTTVEDVRAAGTAPPLWLNRTLPESCTNFYRGVCRSGEDKRGFTLPGRDGEYAHAHVERLERALRWNDGAGADSTPDGTASRDKRLCQDGVHHFLLPAFFFTLSELAASGRDFSVVLRTFGDDGPNAIEAIQAFAEGSPVPGPGGRPIQPVPSLARIVGPYQAGHTAQGEFKLSPPTPPPPPPAPARSPYAGGRGVEHADHICGISLRKHSSGDSGMCTSSQGEGRCGAGAAARAEAKAVATASGGGVGACGVDEGAVLRLMQWGSCDIMSRGDAPAVSAVAVRDDYGHWQANGYLPSAGKPVWVDLSDDEHLHIFFDDNLHPLADDCIVGVRQRASPAESFRALSGEDALALHGIHLVRVPTAGPVLDHKWFLSRIAECEAAWQEGREQR